MSLSLSTPAQENWQDLFSRILVLDIEARSSRAREQVLMETAKISAAPPSSASADDEDEDGDGEGQGGGGAAKNKAKKEKKEKFKARPNKSTDKKADARMARKMAAAEAANAAAVAQADSAGIDRSMVQYLT